MKRLVLTLLVSISAVFAANAQKSLVNESDMKAFTAVNVSDEFLVNIVESESYQLRTTVDERLDPFVASYVKDGVLYITLDRKSFPSELKKALKVKGASEPVLEVEVNAPSVKSIEISDNVIIRRTDEINTDSFTLKVNDKAKVLKMNVNCADANICLSKSSSVNMTVNASVQTVIEASGSAVAVVRCKGETVKTLASGSADIEIIADTENMEFDNSGMSDLVVTGGKAKKLVLNTSGSAKANLAASEVAEGYAVLSGSSKCVVNVKDTLKVNLTGHTTLQFKNNPYIDVEKIVTSTLTRYDESASK